MDYVCKGVEQQHVPTKKQFYTSTFSNITLIY